MTCLACEVAQLKREVAMRSVPETVPNPRRAEAIAKGKNVAGKRTAYTLSSNSVILSERTYGWSIPKTIPNPDFDVAFNAARMMPELCEIHQEIRDLARSNVFHGAQNLGEQVVDTAKQVRDQMAKRRSTQDLRVSVVLPLGEP